MPVPSPVRYARTILYVVAALLPVDVLVLVLVHYLGAATLLPSGLCGVAFTVALGYFVGRGSRIARVLVWLITAGVLINIPLTLGQSMTDGYYDRKPGWFEPVQITSLVVSAAVYLTVAVLLALPAARPYYRRRPAVSESA